MAFADGKSKKIFGREHDIQALVRRAQKTGVTVLVARPLMGKTSTLDQVARRLSAQGHLLGHHESAGGESSHLLYAVSDLYKRWFEKSSLSDQAKILWKGSKGNRIMRACSVAGKMLSRLVFVDKLAIFGDPAKDLFDGLIKANETLKTGGMTLPALSYDDAKKIIKLLAEVAPGRPITLFLDAWEKSKSIEADSATLEKLLRHTDEWPAAVHIFAAVREPDINSKAENLALQKADTLSRISYGTAHIYKLGPMLFNNQAEKEIVCRYVKSKIKAACDVDNDMLLELIGDYPGVLYYWEQNHPLIKTADDLRQEAINAHETRYPEFDNLFKAIENNHDLMNLTARIAFLPRLSENRWQFLKNIVFMDQNEKALSSLRDGGILSSEELGFPSYGHDTRHIAAQKWFLNKKKNLLQDVGTEIVERIIANVTGVNEASRPYIETLFVCEEIAEQLEFRPRELWCLFAAAHSLFGSINATLHPQFDQDWNRLIQINPKYGIIIAPALINRSVIKGKIGNNEGAIADCDDVLAIPDVSIENKIGALINRSVIKGKIGRNRSSIADCDAILALPDISAEQRAKALVNRGIAKKNLKGVENITNAIKDYETVLAAPDAPTEQKAMALVNRGIAKKNLSDRAGAIADYTAVIEMQGVSSEQKAKALINRGVEKSLSDDKHGAIADYTAAIELPDVPAEQKALAYVNRGVAKCALDRNKDAISDYNAVLAMPAISTEQEANTLFNRGVAKRGIDDNAGAIIDYTAIIEMPHSTTEQKAMALINRGTIKEGLHDDTGAIADYDAVIALPHVTAEKLSGTFYNRGLIKKKMGDMIGAMEDFSAARSAQVTAQLMNIQRKP